jgi:predicted dienelactone hydrolase
VLLPSPGHATNAAFSAALGEDLASHGFVVVALNHPCDVGAVALAAGAVAVLPAPARPGRERTAARVAERVADLRFALDRLAEVHAADSPLAGRLDLGRVGALGYSLGGIAAQARAASAHLAACANLDGRARAGAALPVHHQGVGAPPRGWRRSWRGCPSSRGW